MLATTFSIFPNLLQWLSALVIAAPLAADPALPKPADPPKNSVESVIEVKPAEPAKKPAAATLELLDKLEAKSKETKSLHATVRYDNIQGLARDQQTRFGKLVYQAKPSRFALHVDSLRVDKTTRPSNRWYIFDGTWLVEKQADEKQFFKWQVVPPGADPEKADPLAMGHGPFVVPVALRKDLVLARYFPEFVPADAKDPKNSVHLKLTPLKGQRINFTELDLYYDKDTLLPMRARTVKRSSPRDVEESIIDLSNVKINEPVEASQLDTSEPKESGWKVQVTPWEDGAKK